MKIRYVNFLIILLLVIYFTGFYSCSSSAAHSSERGWYLAQQGLVIPPEEIYTDAYIASINYKYPAPDSEMGVYLYNSTLQMSTEGQEGVLQIGIQGRDMSFESLPPMNMAFVIDISSSMNEQDKIAWVKDAVEVFMGKVRDVDYLSLVCFNDSASVVFETTRMDSKEKRDRFYNAVKNISPQGGTNLEAGLKLGYEQLLANFREGSVNRLFFFSDGTEFSQRLARERALSGDVRVSLIWNNRNDLDLYVVTPAGDEIFYGRKNHSSGGFLDVDMNVKGESTKPVENIFWPRGKAPYGTYKVYVQNYAYHERNRGPYDFQVEVKNGRNYSAYEGTVSGRGKDSNTEVCVFEYKGEAALKSEKALVYQMAESYRELGISVSTFGLGVGCDLELMTMLAQEGGGSSRFLSGREEIIKTFDTEFVRMAALAAGDLQMELEFLSGVEVLETWGYQNKIDKNKVSYRLNGLHMGDYETILVRYKLPQLSGTGSRQLARFTVNAKNILGKQLAPLTQTINISLSGESVDGIATGKLLYSGTMMHFAETLKEIGYLYYDGRDGDNSLIRLFECHGKTVAIKAELENAKLRLDDDEVFKKQLEILNNYDELFRRMIAEERGEAPQPRIIPVPEENKIPDNMVVLQNRVGSLFREIALSFPEGGNTVVAISSFVLRDGSEPPLIGYLNQSAVTALAGTPRLRLVERDRIDLVLKEQGYHAQTLVDADAAIRLGNLLGARYIITGQIIPMSTQVIVFGRVINVETGEIVSAAQIFLDRNILGDLI